MALAMPKLHRQDVGQGSQHASLAFGQSCQTMDVRPAMESRGDAYDKAMADSFFASLRMF